MAVYSSQENPPYPPAYYTPSVYATSDADLSIHQQQQPTFLPVSQQSENAPSLQSAVNDAYNIAPQQMHPFYASTTTPMGRSVAVAPRYVSYGTHLPVERQASSSSVLSVQQNHVDPTGYITNTSTSYIPTGSQRQRSEMIYFNRDTPYAYGGYRGGQYLIQRAPPPAARLLESPHENTILNGTVRNTSDALVDAHQPTVATERHATTQQGGTVSQLNLRSSDNNRSASTTYHIKGPYPFEGLTNGMYTAQNDPVLEGQNILRYATPSFQQLIPNLVAAKFPLIDPLIEQNDSRATDGSYSSSAIQPDDLTNIIGERKFMLHAGTSTVEDKISKDMNRMITGLSGLGYRGAIRRKKRGACC